MNTVKFNTGYSVVGRKLQNDRMSLADIFVQCNAAGVGCRGMHAVRLQLRKSLLIGVCTVDSDAAVAAAVEDIGCFRQYTREAEHYWNTFGFLSGCCAAVTLN